MRNVEGQRTSPRLEAIVLVALVGAELKPTWAILLHPSRNEPKRNFDGHVEKNGDDPQHG